MLHLIPIAAVGVPGLVVFAVGGVSFFLSLILANLRSKPKPPGGRRDARSLVGIVLQALGIGVAAFGPLNVVLEPQDPVAITQAVLVGLCMAGTIGLFVASSRAMGRNWAVIAQTRADHQLVTRGPFALMRNPIYVALFLFLVAMGLAYGHYWNILVGAVIYWTGTVMRVRIEERLLFETFGEEYLAYVGRVKRFVPGVI